MLNGSHDVVVIGDGNEDNAVVVADTQRTTTMTTATTPAATTDVLRGGACTYRRCTRRLLPWYKQPLPLRTQLFGFLVLFVVGVFVLAAALLLTNERMPDPRLMPSLPDLLFEVFDKIAWLEPVVDMCIGVLNATAVFIAVKMYLLERQQRGLAPLALPTSSRLGVLARVVNATLLRVVDSGKRPFPLRGAAVIAMIRFVTTYLVMVLYRSVVIIMTSFPPTDNACQHPRKIEHPIWNMVLTVVTFGGGSIHCGDLMFSGHTIILTLGFLVLWSYGTYVHAWAFRVMGTTVLLFSFYCIVASRSHYTDDIVVALYSTIVTFIAIPHRRRGAPWQLQMCIRWCAYIRCCYCPDAQIDDLTGNYEYIYEDDKNGDDKDGTSGGVDEGVGSGSSSNTGVVGSGVGGNAHDSKHGHGRDDDSHDDGQHVAVVVHDGDGHNNSNSSNSNHAGRDAHGQTASPATVMATATFTGVTTPSATQAAKTS